MARSSIHSLHVKQIFSFGIAGTVLGFVYIALVNGFSHVHPFVNGTIGGFLLGILICTFEIYVFGQRLKQSSFGWMLLVRTIIYMICITLIILTVVTINRSIRHGQSFGEALQSQESRDYIFRGNFKTAITFTFIAAILANFTRLVSLKIGRGTLANFFLGAYHKPKMKERIFIFLVIKNAHQVLQKSFVETYHAFLNEIYREVSIAALHNRGYIYEYVEDLVIIYWKGNEKKLDQVLINFHNEVKAALKNKEPHFVDAFHNVPELHWAAHGGEVIQAEIGELKTEIVFHGDVLNTTSRISGLVSKENNFIVSNFILDRIGKMAGIKATAIGEIELRGKTKPISLFTLAI
jgi:adenylate cyclase